MSAPTAARAEKRGIVLAFDVYGTLLSTDSVAQQLAAHCGQEQAMVVAKTWRMYQLEYTWRCNSMGLFFNFEMITRRSLNHALADHNISLSDDQTASIVRAFDTLDAYPDVTPALARLRTLRSCSSPSALRMVVFSNGTRNMVNAGLESASIALPPHHRASEGTTEKEQEQEEDNSSSKQDPSSIFSDVVLVEDCRHYKPAVEAYHHLAAAVGKDVLDAKAMADMWLVSGNPFDIVGAKAVGMNAIWVDRQGTGWRDALMPGMRGDPSAVVRSLEGVVDVAEREMAKK